MNPRERMLLIITVVVVGGLMAFHFLSGTIEEQLASTGGSGELTEARDELQSYIDTLRDSARIKHQYEQLPMAAEGTGDATAEEIFNLDLVNLLNNKFNIPSPRLTAPKADLVPNVEDYYFISITVSALSGTPEQMIDLLREIERMGLIITSFKLDRGAQLRHADEVSLEFDVARLVRHDEQSRRRYAYLRNR